MYYDKNFKRDTKPFTINGLVAGGFKLTIMDNRLMNYILTHAFYNKNVIFSTSEDKYIKYDLEVTERNKQVLELCKRRVPAFKDFSGIVSASGWGVWSWLLAGLGHIPEQVVDDTICNANLKMDLKKMYKEMQLKYNDVPEIFYTHNEFLEDIKKGKI